MPPYDGEYPFDIEGFTNRELHRIKQLTGLRVGELQEAFEAGDNDVIVALAVIVLERSGRKVEDQVIWNAEAGTIRLEFEDQQTEAGEQDDPSIAPQPANGGPSGNPPAALPQENDPEPIGLRPSATSVI